MVRFDEMLDGIISTTKNAAKIAGQKTSEIVEMGKLKYQEQTLTRDVQKAYAKLGAIVYEARIKGEDLDGLVDMAMDEITSLSEKLDTVARDMENAKDTFIKPVEPTVEEPEEINIVAPWDEPLEDLVDRASDKVDDVVKEVDALADDIITKLGDQPPDNE